MKAVSISGCTCDSLTIDGVETVDMKIKDVQKAIKKIVDKEVDIGTLQSVLITLIETRGDYEDLGECECCGDFITKYTLEI